MGLTSWRHRFDAVITDQTMPVMTGLDLARRMLQIRPDLPIILCTGYSSSITEEKEKLLGIKGFTMKTLAKKEIVREVLDDGKPLSQEPNHIMLYVQLDPRNRAFLNCCKVS